MIHKEKIKDWTGKIIGFVETDSVTGNKVVKDFYGKIKGKYNKKLNISLSALWLVKSCRENRESCEIHGRYRHCKRGGFVHGKPAIGVI